MHLSIMMEDFELKDIFDLALARCDELVLPALGYPSAASGKYYSDHF